MLDRYIPSAGEQREAIDRGAGTAAKAEDLAKGLEALATIVRAVVQQSAASVRDKLEEVGIHEAYAVRLSGAAASVRAADKSSVGGDPTRQPKQVALDTADGRNIHVLETIVFAHVDAHAQNASILVPPLGRLSRILAKKRKGEGGGTGGGGTGGGAGGSGTGTPTK